MYIRYDSEGRITACSAIEGVLGGDNTIAVPNDTVPEDLLETFAFGKYLVREGRITEDRSWRHPDAAPAEAPAVPPASTAPAEAPAVAQGGGKSKKGKGAG